MKTVLINNLPLAYSEANGDRSNAIIFLHGNSHSHRIFHNQLNDQRFSDFRIISVDLPGHGDSAPLDNYSLIDLSKIIAQFIKILNLDSFIVVGHSLGGHVSLHLLNEMPPKGIVIFGTPPLSIPLTLAGFMENKNAAPLSLETSSEEDLELLANELVYLDEDKKIFIEDYHKTDRKFRTQLLQTVFSGQYYDEINLLEKFSGKVMAIISSNDKIINNDYVAQIFETKNSILKTIQSAHSPQVEAAEHFNELVLNFAQDTFDFDNYQAIKSEYHELSVNETGL